MVYIQHNYTSHNLRMKGSKQQSADSSGCHVSSPHPSAVSSQQSSWRKGPSEPGPSDALLLRDPTWPARALLAWSSRPPAVGKKTQIITCMDSAPRQQEEFTFIINFNMLVFYWTQIKQLGSKADLLPTAPELIYTLPLVLHKTTHFLDTLQFSLNNVFWTKMSN